MTRGRPTPQPDTTASTRSGIRHVYVHAPFCARRCVYCDFAVTVDRSPHLEPWLSALRGELDGIGKEGEFALADRLKTLYIGGGTPSLLGDAAMQGLAEVLGAERLSGGPLEWTVEANPESFTPALAESWAQAGVNRVSLGVQSFHEPALAWMGRLHGPDGARRAVATARDVGLDDVSIDLIFGLPGHLKRDWGRDLDAALALRPPHLSLYGLTVEADTRLGAAVTQGLEPPVDDSQYREEYLLAARTLSAAGYEHYEVSNFALPGHRSRHNAAYWTGAAYLGLGNGAHSFQNPVRRWNLRAWPDYQTEANQHRVPVAETETLSREARRLERVWLGLRARDGLDRAALPETAQRVVRRWLGEKLAVADGPRLRLSTEGWLVLDRLAVELDGALESDKTAPFGRELPALDVRAHLLGIDV